MPGLVAVPAAMHTDGAIDASASSRRRSHFSRDSASLNILVGTSCHLPWCLHRLEVWSAPFLKLRRFGGWRLRIDRPFAYKTTILGYRNNVLLCMIYIPWFQSTATRNPIEMTVRVRARACVQVDSGSLSTWKGVLRCFSKMCFVYYKSTYDSTSRARVCACERALSRVLLSVSDSQSNLSTLLSDFVFPPLFLLLLLPHIVFFFFLISKNTHTHTQVLRRFWFV